MKLHVYCLKLSRFVIKLGKLVVDLVSGLLSVWTERLHTVALS